MLELGLSGSVRGVFSNEHPYREPGSLAGVAAIFVLGQVAPGKRHQRVQTGKQLSANSVGHYA